MLCSCRNCFLLICVLFSLVEPLLAEDALRLGVFPRRNAETTIRSLTPLTAYLERSLGRPVKLEVSKDFESFWEKVAQQRYDIVHFNQYHYVRSAKEFGYRVILKNEEAGRDTIAGALIVRKDSGLDFPGDLKGKKIVFGGGRSAMVSYIMNKHFLLEAGLSKADYVEEFSVTPPNAVFAVYFGHADGGGAGTFALDLPSVRQRIDPEELKVLAKTESVAHLPWAVHPRLDTRTQNTIQKALLDLKKTENGRQVLKSAGLSALNIAVDGEYDRHRQMIYTVTGEDYCQSGCDAAHRFDSLVYEKPLVVGVFPRRAQNLTRTMFDPLAKALGERLGREIRLVTSKTFDVFWQRVANREFDLVHLNQYQYVKSHKLHGYHIVAKNEEFGESHMTPAIYVRKDSGIDSLEDLRGKRIIFGAGKMAMVSYIGNVYQLMEAGLAEGDYEPAIAINPPDGCVGMFKGQAQACGAGLVLQKLPSVRKAIDFNQVRVLSAGEPFAHLPWAVSNALSASEQAAVGDALISLGQSQQGKQALKTAGITNIEPARDGEYDLHRRLILKVIGEDY